MRLEREGEEIPERSYRPWHRLFKFNSKENGKPDLPALNIIHAKFRILFVHMRKLD